MPTTNEYFVKQLAITGTPSDANDGRDPLGLAITGGSWVSSTKTLTSAGKFGQVIPGDKIYVLSGTGATPGAYTVATVPDTASCTFTESIGPDASDIATSTGPWLTLQFAFDTMATDGSYLNIAADSVWNPTATIDIDTNASIWGNPFLVRGTNYRGIWDGTRATITQTALPGKVDLITAPLAALYVCFSDLRLSGTGGTASYATGNGQELFSWSGTNQVIHFDRCEFDRAWRHCIVGSSTTSFVQFDQCEIHECAGWGVTSAFNGGGNINARRTSFHHCALRADWIASGGGGAYVSGAAAGIGYPGTFDQCLFYANSGPGLLLDSVSGSMGDVSHCVFDGNGAASGHATWKGGIVFDNTTSFGQISLTDTAFSNNTGYAVRLGAASQVMRARRLAFWNNSLGNTNVAEGIADVFGEHISADPRYVSTADRAEDFTLRPDSPLINTALGAATS